MKNLILFLAFAVSVVNVTAQSMSHTIVVESKNGEPFILKVDGFARNRKPASKVAVDGVYASQVTISVVFADTMLAPLKNIPILVERKASKKESNVLKSYTARYQVCAGKKKSKIKKISIVPKQSPAAPYTPDPPKKK